MDNVSGKKQVLCQKTSNKMVSLGFSHITEHNRFGILLCCSDDAQKYRIVPLFNLEGGKIKIRPQISRQLFFTTSEVSRVSGVDFSYVKF